MEEPIGEENHCGHSLMSLSVVELEKRIQEFDMFLLALLTWHCLFLLEYSLKNQIFTKVEKVT